MPSWTEMLMKAVERYGVATVGLCVMVSAMAWHGNRLIESNVEERRKVQASIESERTEDKIYFRSEFKDLVNTTNKCIDGATSAIEDSNKVTEESTAQTQETKEVLKELKTVLQSFQK
jgi:hypothetical protein